MSEPPPEAPPILREAIDGWQGAQRRCVDLLLEARHPGHPVDWAEGFRWVTRIASLAQEYAIEHADPLRPKIFLAQGPTRKLMVDNPDVNYWFVHLDENELYRLTGTRGAAAAVGLTVGTDVLSGVASGRVGTLGQYQLDDFAMDDDGRFEILVGKERPEGARNWIPLPEGAAQIAVRETFGDRARQRAAHFEIERIGPPLPPRDLTPDVAAERIALASRYLLFIARMCTNMWKAFRAGEPNVITGGSGQANVESQQELRSHSASDMAYMGGSWRLEPGEALRVTIHPARGGAAYWGIVLVSPWMESHEYRERAVCTNDAKAQANADGSWTVVIAGEDPGVANWLDTGGRPEGYALIRWVLPATLPPTPTCEVVRVEALRG